MRCLSFFLTQTTKGTTSSGNNDGSRSERDSFFNSSTALTLGIFPLLFFFMFLYYTDVGSTFSVLLMYYLSLGDRHLCAAIVGIYAIFFRQNNVIWVVFTAGVTAVRMLEPAVVAKLGQNSSQSVSLVTEFVRQIFSNVNAMVRNLWPYALVMVFFGAFVFLNGGIVVGDKTNHQVCFNFPQVFYFACFTFFFSFSHLTSPNLIYDMFIFLMGLIRRRYHSYVIIILFTVYYLVENFTYVHPYLLADNRHYTFYVWKNIYKAHPEMKVALIPVYLVALTAIFFSIDRTRLWKFVYAVCVSALLIPQGLLEFRYFILPYVMFRIHLRRPESWKLVSEFLIYAGVNIFTMWVFLKKTFKWPNSPDVQRFMW